MFWKKEDSKSLPDLPQANMPPMIRSDMQRFPLPVSKDDKELSEEEDNLQDRHNLPSFPDSPMNKGFSQAAIKDAINTEEADEVSLPAANFKTIEMEEWNPSQTSYRNISSSLTEDTGQSIPSFEPSITREIPPAMQQFQRQSKDKDIFVKIDKFLSARRALDETKNKLESIDELLKKIREIKLREEQELSYWEKELATVKSRVKELTENIFEKLD